MGLGDLDVVAEDAGVADAEGARARLLAERGLERDDQLGAVLLDGLRGVEVAVVARADHPAVARVRGRAIDERRGELGGDLGDEIDRGAEQLGGAGIGDGGHRGDGERGGEEAVAQAPELARACLAQGGAGAEALEIADAREGLAELGAGAGVGDEDLDLVEAAPDGGDVEERREQAALEQARARRRHGGVDDVEERALAGAVDGARELEVDLGGRVDAERARGIVGDDAPDRDLLPGRATAGEAEGAGRGAHREERVIRERGLRERDLDGVIEEIRERGAVESIVVAKGGPRERERGGSLHVLEACGEDHLARSGAGDLAEQGGRALDPRGGELARREIEEREAIVLAGGVPFPCVDRDEVVVLARVELLGVGDEPGRDDANDLARDDPLDLGGIGHLLAERDLVAEGEELGDVAVRRVVRDAAHRVLVGIALVAAGERDRERPGGDDRILAEELVEIAEAKEEQRIGVARLGFLVLPHHRRELFLGGSLHGARLSCARVSWLARRAQSAAGVSFGVRLREERREQRGI